MTVSDVSVTCNTGYRGGVGDNELDRVREAQHVLDTIDAERAAALGVRDARIGEALDAGHTWVEVQAVSGLSIRGFRLAVGRYRLTRQQP